MGAHLRRSRLDRVEEVKSTVIALKRVRVASANANVFIVSTKRKGWSAVSQLEKTVKRRLPEQKLCNHLHLHYRLTSITTTFALLAFLPSSPTVGTTVNAQHTHTHTPLGDARRDAAGIEREVDR